MRLLLAGTVLIGMATVLGACAEMVVLPTPPITLARVDPDEASERALIGSALGATLGAGLGATFAINPWIGAAVGAGTGAALGAAAGAITAQPVPVYKPIVLPLEPAIPSFYDTWPPGLHAPPIASQTPPPPPVLP